ncbi:MAG: M48 family metallopeptidase [Bacteroidetes bacterium]|nr:M48 family metallopeptidase [Bacteroidota bacterium]MBK9519712.1 M48 family metallopeptidase [Anaeromyxobacter sp.]
MQATFLPVFLGFFAAEQTADLGVLLVNLWHAHRCRGVPDDLQGLVEPEVAERARAYALASGRVALARGLASAAATLGLLFSGLLPWFDRRLDAVAGQQHEFVLFLSLLTAGLALLDLPFAAWRTFGVERAFGFTRVTPRRFLAGRLRAGLVLTALGVPFLYAVQAVMALGGPSWWLWLFGLLAGAQIGLAWVWPVLVAPRFAPQQPLPPSLLRSRLEALATRAGFRPEGIFVVMTGGRGGLPNAALAGLFRPRLLLDDALLTRLGPDALEAVVAHELGHHRLRHLPIRLAVSLAGTFLLLVVLWLASGWAPLYSAFGFSGPSAHAALALVSICAGAFGFWLQPLQAWLARRQEAAADAEAVRLTGAPEPLAAALLDLAEDTLQNPWPHPWYVAWRLTHPPLLERLLAVAHVAVER